MPSITKQQQIEKAQSLFDQGYACSQSVLLAYAEQLAINEHTAKLISSTFGGGMGRLREKCGAVTGGFMVLGLAYGNTEPKDMETKLAVYKKVRDLNARIVSIHDTTICGELLKKHATPTDVEERKHHRLICRRVVADVAGELFEILNQESQI